MDYFKAMFVHRKQHQPAPPAPIVSPAYPPPPPVATSKFERRSSPGSKPKRIPSKARAPRRNKSRQRGNNVFSSPNPDTNTGTADEAPTVGLKRTPSMDELKKAAKKPEVEEKKEEKKEEKREDRKEKEPLKKAEDDPRTLFEIIAAPLRPAIDVEKKKSGEELMAEHQRTKASPQPEVVATTAVEETKKEAGKRQTRQKTIEDPPTVFEETEAPSRPFIETGRKKSAEELMVRKASAEQLVPLSLPEEAVAVAKKEEPELKKDDEKKVKHPRKKSKSPSLEAETEFEKITTPLRPAISNEKMKSPAERMADHQTKIAALPMEEDPPKKLEQQPKMDAAPLPVGAESPPSSDRLPDERLAGVPPLPPPAPK